MEEAAEQPPGECHDKEAGSHAHHHQLSNDTDAEAATAAAGQNSNKGTPRDNGQSVAERHTTKGQCGDNNTDRVNHAMRITGQQRDDQQRDGQQRDDQQPDGQQRDGQLSPRLRDDEVRSPSQQPPCTAQGGETRTRGACLGDVDGGGEKPLDKPLPDIKGEAADTKSGGWETGVLEGDCSDSSDTTGDEEEVDPRVAENLEIMNQCCSDVNRLENELDEARSKYRSTFQASSQRMEELASKIKRSIQRARPYFELTEKAKEAQNEAIRAARQYQTANGNYRAAKEMITLAEQGFDNSTCILSAAWQETLNHATVRVMESEREKTRSEAEHNRRAAIFAELETRLHHLEKKYKRSIAKARPYFETKAELELKLQQLKQNVWDLQQAISTRKARYAEALRRLEALSMEIHECRRSRQKLMLQFPREPGVGAESDSLGSSISDVNIERGVFSSTASFDDNDGDESDDSADVFSQGSPHERAPSRTPHSRRDTDNRLQSDSSASGSVFSSDGAACDSVPQSPTSWERSGASVPAAVSTPAPASAVGGFPGTSSPPPGAVGTGPRVAATECASSGCLPGRVAVAAPGEGRSRDALGARETAPQRNVGTAATERGTAAAADAVLRKNTKEKEEEKEEEMEKSLEPVVARDQRVAGDGSAHDDRPRGEGGKEEEEEEEEEKGRSSETLPLHATDDDPHLCTVNSTVPSLQHPRGGAARDDGGSRVTRPGSPSLRSQGGGGRIAWVAADLESRPRSHSFNEILSKAAGGGRVTKQPLRRTDAKHKALQGVMLLNPSDLAASFSSLRF